MSEPIQRLAPGVVLLTGDAVDALAYCVKVTQRARHRNGLPHNRTLEELAAAAGHTDIDTTTELEAEPEYITTEEAAEMLHCSNRQARRLAPKLGGRLTGGRWLLDRHAVTDHLQGRTA
ncbi:helix-turn-helix domain-containing protein [Rhodococcus zopfii]|uniref:helix-turn-helix domain-containing protein n=1 Tax=Rhodococcus zopfii TaxID=43772 RepID=UPI001110FCDD|nr:helix-turn-helix domain-containing protein [Rhodococcus zopfii]